MVYRRCVQMATGILEPAFLGCYLIRGSFTIRVIRSYREPLTPYIKHLKYWVQASLGFNVSPPQIALNLRRRSDPSGWASPGCPGCTWTFSSAGLPPCSRLPRRGSRLPRQMGCNTTGPRECTLVKVTSNPRTASPGSTSLY